MKIKYRYVVCQENFYKGKNEFIADCPTEERAADFCAAWLREKILEGFKNGNYQDLKMASGGTFNIYVIKIEEK